ncbi:MAG: TolC family protein [Myxococcota bacterium]
MRAVTCVIALALVFLAAPAVRAQAAEGSISSSARPSAARQLRLSLADAVDLALVQSYLMRFAEVDRSIANQQIRQAFSTFFPKLDANASYTRTLETPNPFAGSSAADLFSGFNTGDWVAYNERVRGGGLGLDPGAIAVACPNAVQNGNLTSISFSTYVQCLAAGQSAVRTGEPPAADANPFLVENTFRAGLSASQLIYSGSAFAALRGAEATTKSANATYERTSGQAVEGVTTAYYGVQLARANESVIAKSTERARRTVEEVQKRQREGVVPRFDVLSAEVELANRETDLLNVRNNARAAENALAFNLGIPVDVEIVLTDVLDVQGVPSAPRVDEAVKIALAERPDLEAARQNIDVRRAFEDVTFSRYLPEIRLVADLTVVGNVPDNREVVFANPSTDPNALLSNNPFSFSSEERGFFDESYWGTNFTAGLTLTWNLFEGFATAAQQAEDELETQRARIQAEQLENAIRRDVLQLARDVASALERLQVQTRNVERAELNYRHAELREKEGVTTQLQLREASDQLDQSRFNRLQAIHDYLVANVAYQVAIGRPPFAQREETTDE